MPFADLDLARRLESIEIRCVSRFVAALREIRPEAGAEAIPVAGGFAFFFGVKSPLNEAKGLGMAGPADPDDLRGLGRVYHDRGIPARVVVCPLADPSLLDGLGRLGYRAAGFENVLVKPLGPASDSVQPPGSIAIAPVRAGEESEAWADVLSRGFAAPDEPGPEMREIAAVNTRVDAIQRLMARRDGEPAGAAALFVHDDAAMLCGASTLPAHRKQGVQTALLHARLDLAARLGCRLAVMGAEPGSSSQRNVERLGFRVAYTKLALVLDPP